MEESPIAGKKDCGGDILRRVKKKYLEILFFRDVFYGVFVGGALGEKKWVKPAGTTRKSG